MIQAFVLRSTSRTFRRSFGLILIAEAVTILTAWLLLDVNANRWIQEKTIQVIRIARQAASSADWSRVDKISRGRDLALFERYQERLDALSKQHFRRNEGGVYLVIIESGEEYSIYPGSPTTMDDGGKANQWEREAYAEQKMTYTPAPISDSNGTYLAAYTPVLRGGKVIGLVAAEYDSAPSRDFQSIIRTSFWLSVVPAILVSLIIAYILASMFVEPMDLFRTVEETAKDQRAGYLKDEKSDFWHRLTHKEKEVAELARQGLTGREIAAELSVSPETVKQHLKNIREKTGWSKVDLAVQAQARRTASSPL